MLGMRPAGPTLTFTRGGRLNLIDTSTAITVAVRS
jgi:hypothetical protein